MLPVVATFDKPSSTVPCGYVTLRALALARTALKETVLQLATKAGSTFSGISTFTGSPFTLVPRRNCGAAVP